MLAVPKQAHDGGRNDHSPPLKETEVYKLRSHYGLNTVHTGKRRVWYKLLLEALFHPFNILLCLLATTSGIAGEYETMGIMLIMVFLSTALRFHQEWKSQVAVESLLSFVATKVTVIRNDMVLFKDMEYIIPSTELVPGDWVRLSPGDVVPADMEVMTAKDFHVSQAALTGEAIPVLKYNRGRQGSWISVTAGILENEELEELTKKSKKKSEPNFNAATTAAYLKNKCRSIFGVSPAATLNNSDVEGTGGVSGVNFSDMDRPDICFMGSAVISGKATCRVVNTGPCTIFGKLAKELAKKRPANSFQLGVRRISWVFFMLMICMVPPVLLLQGLLQHDWFDAFMFALSVAVGLTPEMLPMIVNTTLAKGAMEMSKKKCIVKQLDGIIIMGAVDVLCTDKTGTLTKSVVTLYKHVNEKGSTSSLPLLLGYLNAHYQTCHENPIDAAITSFYQDSHHPHSPGDNNDHAHFRNKFDFIEEIPFDFIRRRISVVVRETDRQNNTKPLLICKGAVEEMLDVCSSFLNEPYGGNQGLDSILCGNSTVEPMTGKKRAQLENLYERLSEDGLRVIGVAYKLLGDRAFKSFGVESECQLTFVGFLAFLDPPKESTSAAIKNLMDHNVAVKVLTGDSPLVCKKICGEIGLKVDQVITGQDLAKITDNQEFANIAKDNTIFAKLTPLQKSDIVKALKLQGHVVGFLGDGINDTPALSEADVGISVDTGMDICKESADIILLEKDLTVIVDAVITGRMTYGNTLKYIVMGMSSNFGNVFSILVASAFLPFQPMASLHILVQNLLYDVSQMAIPWDTMDPDYLLVPHQWSMKNVLRFMVMIGPWSSIFDIATFLYLYFYFGIQTSEDAGKVRTFQSSWFCVGMLTQTLIVHIIRTAKVPFFESWATVQVTLMTFVILCVGLSLPYIPMVNGWFMLVPLSWQMYPFMLAVIVCYCAVVQTSKVLYLKLFKEWY